MGSIKEDDLVQLAEDEFEPGIMAANLRVLNNQYVVMATDLMPKSLGLPMLGVQAASMSVALRVGTIVTQHDQDDAITAHGEVTDDARLRLLTPGLFHNGQAKYRTHNPFDKTLYTVTLSAVDATPDDRTQTLDVGAQLPDECRIVQLGVERGIFRAGLVHLHDGLIVSHGVPIEVRHYGVDAIAVKQITASGELAALIDDDQLTVPADAACLLYTSPSPRDATLSRMPSSA